MLKTSIKIALMAGVAAIASQSVLAMAAQVYTVKFVCGTQRPNADLTAPSEPPVKPGNYATVINIEGLDESNSGGYIVSPAGIQPVKGGSFSNIAQFTTVDVTCVDIAKALPSGTPAFITGYLNVLTGNNVKVTAVYSSQGCTFLGVLRPVCSGQTAIDVVPETPTPFRNPG